MSHTQLSGCNQQTVRNKNPFVVRMRWSSQLTDPMTVFMTNEYLVTTMPLNVGHTVSFTQTCSCCRWRMQHTINVAAYTKHTLVGGILDNVGPITILNMCRMCYNKLILFCDIETTKTMFDKCYMRNSDTFTKLFDNDYISLRRVFNDATITNIVYALMQLNRGIIGLTDIDTTIKIMYICLYKFLLYQEKQ